MKTIMCRKTNRAPRWMTSCPSDQTATWSSSPYKYLKNRSKSLTHISLTASRYRRGRTEPSIFTNWILISKNSQLTLLCQLPRRINFSRGAKTRVLSTIRNIDLIVLSSKTSPLWQTKMLAFQSRDLWTNNSTRYSKMAFLEVHWVSMRLRSRWTTTFAT